MDSPRKQFGFIENCNWEVAIQCPLRWESLDETDDPGVRHCFTCLKKVYRCESQQELQHRVSEGKCVVFMYSENEFLGLITEMET